MRRPFITCLIFSLGLFWSTLSAHAGVVFFDSVTTTHTPVYLRVLTKGLLFPEGGRLVEIYAGDRKVGRVLSGGDGYGFMKIAPEHAGLQTFVARMDAHSDSAYLLVLEKTDRVLLFEIEILSRTLFSKSPGRDAQKALNTLNKQFKLIYLTRLAGPDATQKIIETLKLPASAVLKWQGPEVLEDLKSRRINLTAIIGSADMIADAAEAVPYRFTFEETDDETYVESWQDIIQKLR